LNWTGGLIQSIASREFCPGCRDKMYDAGVAIRARQSFSCDEIIGNLESMVSCLDRIEKIKRTGNFLKLAAWTCFTMFGVSLILSIISNYTNDITFVALLRRYAHPVQIAIGSVGVGVAFLIGAALCGWISPGRRAQI